VSGYFITDTAWEEEAISLKKVLKEKVPEADYQSYYRNGYDAPMRIFNRRNEVWFRKTGEAAQKTIDDYKKRQAEKIVVAPVAAEEEKKPAADEKKPVADEKKTTEKKTEEKKKVEEVKKTEEPKKDAAQNRE
jgi:hypothetical protein